MALRTFYLNKSDGKLMGVCAGIADYTGVDATLIRIGAVVVTILGGFPWTVLAYAVAAAVAKSKPVSAYGWDQPSQRPPRTSAYELRNSMRDIDRRMAEVETYVTSTDSSLAREIEQLRRAEPVRD